MNDILQQILQMIQSQGDGRMGGGMRRDPPMMDGPPDAFSRNLGRGPEGQMGQGAAMPFASGPFGQGSGSNSSVAGLPPVNVIDNPGEASGQPMNGGFPGPSGGRFNIPIGVSTTPRFPTIPGGPTDSAQGGDMMSRLFGGMRRGNAMGGMMRRQPMGDQQPVTLSRLSRY